MTSTDDLDDARVLASLGRILSAGDPYTGLPLVDLETNLFPDEITAALREVPLVAAAAAQATADAAVPATEKGAASGVAQLDTDSLVPAAQIPMQAIADDEAISSTIGAVEATTEWLDTVALSAVAGDYSGRPGVAGSGTDDRAAIQAMLDAARDPKPGDTTYYADLADRAVQVTLPAGIYYISAPTSGASLTVPNNVTFDTRAATLVFQPPASSTQTWCGIEIRNYGSLLVGRLTTKYGASFPSGDNWYDGVRLVATDNSSRVIGYASSQISGFQGAGIRGIGAYISHIKGIRFQNVRYGYVASNVGDGYGLTYHASMVAGRKHTEIEFADCQFVNINIAGVLGVTTGLTASPNALDFTTSGLSMNFRSCSFEQIGSYAISAGNVFNLGADHCHFENVGNGDGMINLNTVRVAVFTDTQINFAGVAAPDPSGTGTAVPNPSHVFKVASVQSIDVIGLYLHNSYRAVFGLFNGTPGHFSTVGIFTDSYALASGVGAYQNRSPHFAGTYDYPVIVGTTRLWTDAAGLTRTKAGTPSSDTDGSILGRHGVKATRSAALNLVSGTVTAIDFTGTEVWDTDAFHDTSTNPSRITIPTGMGGQYALSAQIPFAASSVGKRLVRILKNGTLIGSVDLPPHASTGPTVVQCAVDDVAVAGDYYTCEAMQDSGGSLGVDVSTRPTWFNARLVG